MLKKEQFPSETQEQSPEEVAHIYEELKKIPEKQMTGYVETGSAGNITKKGGRKICTYKPSELFAPIINDNNLVDIKKIYEKIEDALLSAKSPVNEESSDANDVEWDVIVNIEKWYAAAPNLSQASENPIEIIFPRKYKNRFADKLIWRAFDRGHRYANALDPVFQGGGAHNAYTLVTCTSLDLNGAKEFIDGCKKHRAKWESLNPKYHFLYYILFVLAVDDDAFSNELNSVSEFIYFLDFSEDIIDDFLWVVLEVLSDKKTNTHHNFSTTEARIFFERN